MPATIRPLLVVILLIGITSLWNPSDSKGLRLEKGRASHIRVKNDSATMYATRNYLVTQSSGAVGRDGIPVDIRLGDAVQVQGQVIKVNHIFWKLYLERAQYKNQVLADAGDVQCVLVETLEDLPYSDDYRDRLWITVEHCEVLTASAP